MASVQVQEARAPLRPQENVMAHRKPVHSENSTKKVCLYCTYTGHIHLHTVDTLVLTMTNRTNLSQILMVRNFRREDKETVGSLKISISVGLWVRASLETFILPERRKANTSLH